jgi:uncharacterized coiled-coil protein SlyX
MEVEQIKDKLAAAFPQEQAGVLIVMLDNVHQHHNDLAKASDFTELREIMRDLAEAQAKTEQTMDKLGKRMDGLAAAQAKTEQTMNKLAEAQAKTEEAIRKLTGEMGNVKTELGGLSRSMGDVKTELGGLSRSMGYAMENEAYRHLPRFLQEAYGIELTERFVRKEIDGEEINIFGRGKRAGREVLVIGESALRITSAGKKLGQLDRKLKAVRKAYPEAEVVEVLIAHYATPEVLEQVREKGIIVVQSFEWQ